ncbi:MAG: aldehyde ferredoxin oxidoreductase C-terminal domain-containing protein, partial [Promethearchaeota archaeon]
ENTSNMKNLAAVFTFGTGGEIMEYFATIGNLPIRNFRDGEFSKALKIDPKTIHDTIGLGKEACYACSIRCKKVVQIDEPWNIDPIYGGPEYETIAAFGSNCGIDDINAICKASEICNKYSLDTISTGVTIGFAMECYENGILTEKEVNGIKLNFGNAKAMIQMVKMIGKREGLGKILGEGVKRAAEKIGNGAEKYAIHVKGQEVPMHEPRLKQGLGLGYAVSPTGAEHMANLHDTSITSKERISNFAPLGILEPLALDDLGPKKVRAVMYVTNWQVVENSLIMCFFNAFSVDTLKGILNAVTGWNTTTWELMKLGERITTMARVFNIREGLTKDDDWLPERFFKPTTSGTLSKTAINPEEFENARSTYYKMMGWDDNGIPTTSKLEELDIEWASKMLP